MQFLDGIKEGDIDAIASQEILEGNIYNINIADGGITNAQMAKAITHPELFNEGDVYQCVDSGTYIENHFYKFTGSDWKDTTLEWQYPLLNGNGTPLSTTKGIVNQFYLDKSKNDIYVCTEIDTTSVPNTYTWELVTKLYFHHITLGYNNDIFNVYITNTTGGLYTFSNLLAYLSRIGCTSQVYAYPAYFSQNANIVQASIYRDGSNLIIKYLSKGAASTSSISVDDISTPIVTGVSFGSIGTYTITSESAATFTISDFVVTI